MNNCLCGVTYRSKDKGRHEKSKNHMNFVNQCTNSNDENIYEEDSIGDTTIGFDDPLDGLTRDVYESNIQDEEQAILNEKLAKENQKLMKKAKAKVNKDDVSVASNDLFSKVPTEILGKDRRVLLAKIRQYKSLFPDDLKSFKIKKNPTVADLDNVVSEMDAIISTNNVENFMTDGILQSMRVIEGASTYTAYNISGLSDILRNNKQFHSLCKQLYIKYNTFAHVDPEYQMLFLVATSAYICRQKNIGRAQMDAYLNEPANIPQNQK
jgi:hypothetical protein